MTKISARRERLRVAISDLQKGAGDNRPPRVGSGAVLAGTVMSMVGAFALSRAEIAETGYASRQPKRGLFPVKGHFSNNVVLSNFFK